MGKGGGATAQAPRGQAKLIVTDGVFSMLGDLVDLPRMSELAAHYNARILVDDAHGVGGVGPEGRGTAAYLQTCLAGWHDPEQH